jgi:hypothetical protein
MNLEITGKVVQKLSQTEGISKAGKPWSKQEFVIETQEQYPRKVCISIMNEKVTELQQYNEGDMITAAINIESREWNGKWYTEVRAWKLQGTPSAKSPDNGGKEYQMPGPDNMSFSESTDDDLPF